MPVLFRMALRNLRQHRGKTLIIGILVAVGIFVLVLGDSLLRTAAAGTEVAVIDNYTGHLMVRAISDSPVAISGTADITGDLTGKAIPDYQRVYQILQEYPEIAHVNPQITAFGQIDLSTPDQNRGAWAFMFGIEPEAYQKMFGGNLKIIEGRFLQPGEAGVVLSEVVLEEIRERFGIHLKIGDELKFQGVDFLSGLSIKRLPLVGVYLFEVDTPALRGFTFVDAQSLRSMTGMVLGAGLGQEIAAEDTALLSLDGDSLFSEDLFFSDDALFSDDIIDLGSSAEVVSEDSIFDFLGDLDERFALSQPDSGSWTYALMKLHDPARAPALQASLNARFAEEGIMAEIVDWTVASGGVASMNQAMVVFFMIMVLLLTTVSVIIIMNTLVISVVERTYEIGAMRALGAQRDFVRKMFLAETMTISYLFGAIGFVLGALSIAILNAVGIEAPNDIFAALFGGETLRPIFTPSSVILAVLVSSGIGLLSSIYPVSVALKIQPVKALQSV